MIILLMGVTGSGKTTVGKLLAAKLGWAYYDADDFHSPANVAKMKRGSPLDDRERQPWLASLRALIASCLERDENCVLACSALKQSYRDYLLLSEQVRLVYLQGTRDLIQRRLAARSGHFMNPKLLDSQFQILEEPVGELTLDVSLPAAELVTRIAEALVDRNSGTE
jgi:gluconokinase